MRLFRLIKIWWQIKHRNMSQKKIDRLVEKLKNIR